MTRSHIRSGIVGAAAVFLLLTASASAAVAPANSVVSRSIKDGEVKNPDLGTGAVTGGKVATDTLTGAKIKESALDFAVLQKRVAGLCPVGKAIRIVKQDGSVVCQKVPGGTVKSVATGTGLAGGPITSTGTLQIASPFRLPQGCASDEIPKWNGAAWVCASQGATGAWSLSGNAGTTSSNFLGTTDNQPLDLRVNGARGLRIEPATDGTNESPNVIGGIADNSVTAGVHAATIGGGGRSDPSDAGTANRVTDDQGTVGGGADNQAGDGAGTVSDRAGATVGGGADNTAGGEHATVGGGIFNTANGSRATVAGGQFNGAGGDSAAVAGGSNNSASGDLGAVGGGNANLAGGQGSTVGGGEGNHASGDWAAVPGGNQSTAGGDLSFAAGLGAQASDNGSFVWADSNPFFFPSTAQNQFSVRSTGGVRLVSGVSASGTTTSGLELPANTSGWSTLVNGQPFEIKVNGGRALRIEPASNGTSPAPNMIAGGLTNTVTTGVHGATIAGGAQPASDSTKANQVTDSFGTVGGGANNRAGDAAGFAGDKAFATVTGGQNNVASGAGATVAGGTNNLANGQNAAVPGGFDNGAHGDNSFAAGFGAQALGNGTFVWADSNPSEFFSTAANEFSVRATGGTRFVSGVDGSGNPNAGVQLAPGGGSWSSLSDRSAKRAIRPVSGRRVLHTLASVPVSTWSYRAQDPSIRHIGPMAQDFYRAFGVGEDRKHIDSIDADGVALAAIKGLSRKVERLQRKVASLQKREP